MNKKYFFFDIDGTLTDNKTKEVVPSAKKAIELLIQNGHFVTIATGRAHYKARKVQQEIGVTNMVANGGNSFVINNQLIENIPLDSKKARMIYKDAKRLGYGVIAAINDSIEVYSDDLSFIKQTGWRLEPTKYFIDPAFDIDQIDTIYKLYIALPKEEETNFPLLDTLGHIRFEGNYIMFQPDNKIGGILNMMKHLQADIKDVVVFGDDYNDLVMFDNRWYSIAMGNAPDELKAKANFVTKKNTEDGIYYACKQHGWI